MARKLGLENIEVLDSEGDGIGLGVTGYLPQPLDPETMISVVKDRFALKGLRCSRPLGRKIEKVALCGGAGAFLLPQAIASGADCFVCGEFHYHDYFENAGVRLVELGHYQSEQYTQQLLRDILHEAFPMLETVLTGIDTNPIDYM